MKYVIKKTDSPRRGWYASLWGSDNSYTPKLQEAQTFNSFEAANAHVCSNERIVSVESELKA